MGQTWTDTPIHFIDFEGNATSGILEFGVVTLLAGEITAAHTRLCRATGRVSADDTKVHGLSADGLASQEYFAAEWERFAGLRATGPLAAHFAPVENSLLRKVWPYPREVPDFARPGKISTEWGPWIDTGRLYPQLFPQAGSFRLEDLVMRQGLPGELEAAARRHCPPERRRYHAALYDALAGALLLASLLKRPEFSTATLPWLLQMSTADGEKRSALQQGDLF
ncbi:3'-5' exonuclease [Oleiharenicola lentus]|uniref:3'-5' exonuclease n=1 Tax=Oleiharenicola lentus TaxID=2508720 RepID=A0A4V1M6D4_9BACT|nr:3'-5' exonuclease [Oleiharenicola lentus]RXK55009.1 3'-5' exonuclease [Oleiharenicola lentus]